MRVERCGKVRRGHLNESVVVPGGVVPSRRWDRLGWNELTHAHAVTVPALA
jgi:hypothetical protein